MYRSFEDWLLNRNLEEILHTFFFFCKYSKRCWQAPTRNVEAVWCFGKGRFLGMTTDSYICWPRQLLPWDVIDLCPQRQWQLFCRGSRPPKGSRPPEIFSLPAHQPDQLCGKVRAAMHVCMSTCLSQSTDIIHRS